ncbi:hypothetical protein N431DRAFT_532541 [Stipitochalara longipes BDJ]|nr:hypothetical protein N431DRAFT_532541 [Stipitochalara longipes BDJ]
MAEAETSLKTDAEQQQQKPPSRAYCNPFAPPSPVSNDHQTNKSEPLWKQCESRPRVQQVKINEEAAAHSRQYLENVEIALREFRHLVTSCDTRLKEIAAIKERKKECEVRIGFLGGTGTGKSSLINALLKMSVLPRNEEVASTAVPVEVSYNHNEDPAYLYRAIIEGISKAEFTKEIQDLFEAKRLWDIGPEGEDDEPDVEIYQQMLTTIEKIKWLYPDLQRVEDLSNRSAIELLDAPYVKKMLDSKTHVSAENEASFAKHIKKYIESSKPKEGETAAISLWPLVKVVRIYVKAEILKPGIILVDLPGSHDTSAARVAVTDNYRKNLTASVVCAPAVRAGSDRVAQELLTSVERRNMQLDGLYTSESLFFVVTKIDDLMDYEAYIRDHDNLQKANEKDMQTIKAKSESIEESEQELSSRAPKHEKNVGRLQTMITTEESLANRVDKFLDAMTLSGQKRKRMDDLTASEISHLSEAQRKQIKNLREVRSKLSEQTARVQKEGSELFSINQQKKRDEEELLITESRVMKSCIQNRALIHVDAARDEYKRARRMMGQQRAEQPLQVFSVSSDAYSRILRGRKKEALRKGFSGWTDTGIPELRDALSAVTWGIRQQNARSFNEDIENCLIRMKMWSADTSSEYKMLSSERAIVEDRMDSEIKKLEQAFSTLNIETRKEVMRLVDDGIYKDFPKISKASGKAAVDKVTIDWCLVAWNTHRSTNRLQGSWKDSHKRVYDWNEDLASIFLERLIKSWTKTFHSRRPELLRKYETKADELIVSFTESLMTSAHDIHPAIDEAIQSLKENVLSLRSLLKNDAKDIFEQVNQSSKEAHRTVKPEVLSSWTSTYQQCGCETGTGLYKRNKKTHRDYVNGNGGVGMYKKAGAKIQKTLNDVLSKLGEKFNASYNRAVMQLREDLKVMLERHSVGSMQTSGPQSASFAKERLQKILQTRFDELEKAWGIEPAAEIEESEDIKSEQLEEALDDPDSDGDDFDPEKYLS